MIAVLVAWSALVALVFAWPSLPNAVPAHVLTSSRVGFTSPPQRAWSAYAPYLTWAQTDPPYAAGAKAVGIKTYWYSNPNRQMPGQDMYTSDESTFAHDCGGRRIRDTQVPALQLMQPSSGHLAGLWLTVAQQILTLFPYAAIFEDDTADVWGVDALPCGYDPKTWLDWSLGEAGRLKNAGIALIYNGLSPMGPGPSISQNIAMNAVAIGGMMEGCYMRPSTTNEYVSGAGWQIVEGSEIAMAREGKFFWCYADDYDASAPQVLGLRIYAYASFLMSYDPSTSVYESNFTDKNDFNVMPESLVVALQPLTPAPRSASDLRTPTGAYGRQYAACYLGGAAIGACAAVVNADPFHAHGFPYGGYSHTIIVSGGDVLDGGRISAGGPEPPSTLPALGAVIAVR